MLNYEDLLQIQNNEKYNKYIYGNIEPHEQSLIAKYLSKDAIVL